MNTWIENYIKSLVSVPDQVEVSEKAGVLTHVFSVKVAQEDLGLFLGRSNRLVRALSSAACLAGAKSRRRYVVKVV